MQVRALQLNGFRNLKSTTIEPGPRFNVISGHNGQGKTNLIEALYSVCTLRSFRSSRLRDAIHIQGESAYVGARVERNGLIRRYELTIHPRSRIVRLDNKAVRPISRYFGGFNVVLFAPEDLLVVRGTPADRRKFLDRAIFTLQPEYLSTATSYEKILKSRNATLRSESVSSAAREQMLDVYDEQIATFAATIVRDRVAYLDSIRELFQDTFTTIARSGYPAGLRYSPDGAISTTDSIKDLVIAFLEGMKKNRAKDIIRGATSLGPHRDVLLFSLGEQPASQFASQGQMRAMILAWKIAEMQLLAQKHADSPILLLDDVSSELDPERNEYLFDFLKTGDSQCFITTTHPNFVLLTSERHDFHVHAGTVDPHLPKRE